MVFATSTVFSTDGFIVFFHRNSCGDFGPFEKLIDSV